MREILLTCMSLNTNGTDYLFLQSMKFVQED